MRAWQRGSGAVWRARQCVPATRAAGTTTTTTLSASMLSWLCCTPCAHNSSSNNSSTRCSQRTAMHTPRRTAATHAAATDDGSDTPVLTQAALVQTVQYVLAHCGPLPLPRLSAQLDDDAREAVAQHYRDGLLSLCLAHPSRFVVVTLSGGVRIVMDAALLRDVHVSRRVLLARVLAVLTARAHFARPPQTTLSSTRPTIVDLHRTLVTYDATVSATAEGAADAAAAEAETRAVLASVRALHEFLLEHASFVIVGGDDEVPSVRLHPRLQAGPAAAAASSTGDGDNSTTTARRSWQLHTPARSSATMNVGVAPNSVAAQLNIDARAHRLERFVRDTVPSTFYVPLSYILRRPRSCHVFSGALYKDGDTGNNNKSTVDKMRSSSSSSSGDSGSARLWLHMQTQLLSSVDAVLTFMSVTLANNFVDVRRFGDDAARVFVRCLKPHPLSSDDGDEQQATATAATAAKDRPPRGNAARAASSAAADDTDGLLLPSPRTPELDAQRYNCVSLCERIVRDIRAYASRDAQAPLRLLRGLTMSQMHEVLSPDLMHDIRAFFRDDSKDDDSSEKNSTDDNKSSNKDSSDKDSKDCACYILLFDRMRHLFDVDYRTGVVRPWSALPASAQPITLMHETTPLPLVLTAMQSVLDTCGPQTTEQLYARLPTLSRLQLLALYVSPSWAAPGKASALATAPHDAAMAAVRAFVQMHTHYVFYRDTLIYTPGCVAAEDEAALTAATAAAATSSFAAPSATAAAPAPAAASPRSASAGTSATPRTTPAGPAQHAPLLRSCMLTDFAKLRMVHDMLSPDDVLLWHGVMVHPAMRALPFSVRTLGMHQPQRYASLFRMYEPFACHLPIFTRGDTATRPPAGLLQPRMTSLRVLVKFMALSSLGGEADSSLTNHISREGRSLLRLYGIMSEIAQQLPMWFEVRRDEQAPGASIVTYIGPLPSGNDNKTKNSSSSRSGNNDSSTAVSDEYDAAEEEQQQYDKGKTRYNAARRRPRPVMVLNRTLEPIHNTTSRHYARGAASGNRRDALPEWAVEDDDDECGDSAARNDRMPA